MKHPKLDWLITCTEDDINSSPRKHTNVFMYCMDVCVLHSEALSTTTCSSDIWIVKDKFTR